MELDERWYPLIEDYYVESPDPHDFPVRQGDVMLPPPALAERANDPWVACQVVHPSCELVAKNLGAIQVIRVYPLSAKTTAKDQQQVVDGYALVGEMARVAFANTFFLPPAGSLVSPMFSDFRQVESVRIEDVSVDRRLGALTHDTRVYFIRRKLHWEQRWMLALSEIQLLESKRISNDSTFIGPRPLWAPAS